MQSTIEGIGFIKELNSFIAYSSITILFALIVLSIRDLRHLIQGKLIIAFLLSAAALIIVTLPIAEFFPNTLTFVSKLVAVPNLALLWLFCLALLRDDFRLHPRYAIGCMFLTLIPSIYFLEFVGIEFSFIELIRKFGDIPPLLMTAHIIWVALSERSHDLVEGRRTARLWMVFALLASLIVGLISENIDNEMISTALRSGIGTMPTVILFQFWLAKISPETITFGARKKPHRIESEIDPRDFDLHKRLVEAIQTNKEYLRPTLSIDNLANSLKAPPHQLRKLINGAMGYRNFSSFLNSYRINYAKLQLAMPERARVSVLEIAFESGFNSLPSFNRLFKEIEGVAPSEYRSNSLRETVQK